MIEWDKKFEIGHPRIDFEHQIFLGLILDFKAMAVEGKAPERLLRILNEIVKYAEFHFVSEENIMLDCGYPLYAEHVGHHQALLSRLRAKCADLRTNVISPLDLYEFLFDWFALHTSQEDKKIAQYLQMGAEK